jgi:hypothetical protein
MTRFSERWADYEPLKPLPVTEPIRSFVQDVRAVRRGGTIRIYSGEANPVVYNHPDVINAFVDAQEKREATIRVSVSPAVVTDGSAYNGLLRLHERGVVQTIQQRPMRGKGSHYRIVETDGFPRYYEEAYHPPLAPVESRACIDLSPIDLNQAREVIETAIAEFDGDFASPEGSTDQLPTLLVTASGLNHVVDEAHRHRTDFDLLGAEDIKRLASIATDAWMSASKASSRYPDEWILMEIGTFDHARLPEYGYVIAHSKRRADISRRLRGLHTYKPDQYTSHHSYYVFHAAHRAKQ